jgi:hypothetical protein
MSMPQASSPRSRLPGHLLYTIALLEALRLPRPLSGASVMALLDRDPACLQRLPESLVQQINHTYYTIGAMLDEFVECPSIQSHQRAGADRRVYHSPAASTFASAVPPTEPSCFILSLVGLAI